MSVKSASVALPLNGRINAVGCSQARRYALTQLGIDSSSLVPLETPYRCCGEQYSFRALAYAPFFVTTTFDYQKGEFGYYDTYVFFWFGVLGPHVVWQSWIT